MAKNHERRSGTGTEVHESSEGDINHLEAEINRRVNGFDVTQHNQQENARKRKRGDSPEHPRKLQRRDHTRDTGGTRDTRDTRGTRGTRDTRDTGNTRDRDQQELLKAVKKEQNNQFVMQGVAQGLQETGQNAVKPIEQGE